MKALPFFSKYCNASSMRTASSTERPRGSSFTSWCRTIPDLGKEFVSVLSETQVLVLEYPKTLQVKCGLSCLNTCFYNKRVDHVYLYTYIYIYIQCIYIYIYTVHIYIYIQYIYIHKCCARQRVKKCSGVKMLTLSILS